MNEQLDTKIEWDKALRAFGALSFIVGLICSIWFLCSTGNTFEIPMAGQTVDISSSGQFGDYIGGVVGTLFSLAGFIILLLTFRSQKDAFQREQFENRFIELVKFHRENVNDFEKFNFFLKTGDPNLGQQSIRGKLLIKYILDEIEYCLQESDFYFADKSVTQIYRDEYLLDIKSLKLIEERKLDLIELSHLNICYLIVFFGLGRQGHKILQNILDQKYRKEFYAPLLKYLALKPAPHSIHFKTWVKISIQSDKISISNQIHKLRNSIQQTEQASVRIQDLEEVYYNNEYFKYYGGHQLRLGHYFRHLFQTVNYVNDQIHLTYREKYQYIKTLRAQLSTHEQALIFFNSLSVIGDIWELSVRGDVNDLYSDQHIALVNKQLITKYNFIKNIPSEFLLTDFNYRHYYPLVKYEGDKPMVSRKELETQYF